MKSFLTLLIVSLILPLQTFANEVVAVADTALKKPFMEYGFISDVLNFMLTIPTVGPYVMALLSFMGTMSILAAALPAGTPGTKWYTIRKWFVDLPAANVLNAKNKQ